MTPCHFGTWRIITKACDHATHPKALDDFNPWNAPEPKRDFVLTLGFALQRANSRMLRGADKRRRKARGSGLYSAVGYIPLAPALSHLPRMMIISGDFGVSGFNFVIL